MTVAPASSLGSTELAGRLARFPRLRFMGSKYRLLPWLHQVLDGLEFTTALDAFSGSGSVAYLLKAMGKEVTTNDFLRFPAVLARALIENQAIRLPPDRLAALTSPAPRAGDFIERTFAGIFFTGDDLRFLDRVSWHVGRLGDPYERALAMAALLRSCAKRQPRGVFTVAGDPERYKDGRRDLTLSLAEHFPEQVEAVNAAVFEAGREHRALSGDVFEVDPRGFDLVYLDPPYVPRADDNCYVKRYHFLEGLACYWRGVEIVEESRVKKIAKRYTPFSYRRHAGEAFDRLFARFADSTLVLSYSSNGWPDLDDLVARMRRVKRRVEVMARPHRYSFGTHGAVERARVDEYLILGT